MSDATTTDRDEYGQPVTEHYKRLGANSDQDGMYVRFEPGFGLNVHIGFRLGVYPGEYGRGQKVYRDFEDKGMVMGIDGWERLGELVDEWRARNAADG